VPQVLANFGIGTLAGRHGLTADESPMNVLLFGATGMIGQGVLRECLHDDRVKSVIAVARAPLAVTHPKLRTAVHQDFTDFSAIAPEFAAVDACFFCLGTSSAGMSEDAYRRITHDFTLAAARALPVSPAVTFVYVSAAGTDSASTLMFSRIRGETENELLAMPLRAYMVRPAFVYPVHGEVSRTPLYRRLYAGFSWLFPLLRLISPHRVTTTENMGRAMLAIASGEWKGERILHSPELNRAAAR
jgi:uncharacterized protein YbjT (DUF2867 family)